MAFRRRVENFDCERCGTSNTGDGYTNHCSSCLYSKHVDVDPGDRAETCHGPMAPVAVLAERGRHVLVHRCVRCGVTRRCRTSERDDWEAVLTVARDRATEDGAFPNPRHFSP